MLVVQNRVENKNADDDEPDSVTRKQFGINKIFNLNIKTAAETAPRAKLTGIWSIFWSSF